MATTSYIDPATGLRKYGVQTAPDTTGNPLLGSSNIPTAPPPITVPNPLLPTAAPPAELNPLLGSTQFESAAAEPQGSVAVLDPMVQATIEAQIHGKMDNTLKNLVFAHLEVFGTLPDFSLTADILDNGQVEFATKEEAVNFFQTVAQSYAGTGSEWKLDKSGTLGQGNPILGADKMRKENPAYSPETDVLDPEMIASFRPKKVEDFLLGPYMKRTIPGKSSMYRDGALRLDEMLIAVPKQWAISQLNTSLTRDALRSNPDQNHDEALMIALNKYIAERVPNADMKPAPTAVWQPQTEAGLRELQMMRASALYVASSEGGEPKGEQAQQAAAYLQSNGYGNILTVLDQQIRTAVMPSGSTPEEQRKHLDANAAWVEQMWTATRNPGVSQRMALHQLATLNPNAVTSATTKMIGTDGMKSRFGVVFGWLGHVPGHEEMAQVWDSNEFKAIRGTIPALVGDIADTLDRVPAGLPVGWKHGRPAIVAPPTVKSRLGDSMKLLLNYYTYTDYVLVTALQDFGDWGKEKHLPGWMTTSLPLQIAASSSGQGKQYQKLDEMQAAYRDAAFGQYLAVHNKANPDGIEAMGSFVDRWKFYWHNNQDAKEAGIPMQYTDEIMRRLNINPQNNPEMSFILGFAADTIQDFGVLKVAGIAGKALKAVPAIEKGINTGRTMLEIKSQAEVATHIAAETLPQRSAAFGAKKIDLLHPKFEVGPVSKGLKESDRVRQVVEGRGTDIAVHSAAELQDEYSFVARMSSIYGTNHEDLVNLSENLMRGVLTDGTKATQEEIIRDALPKLSDPMRGPINPDGWAIHERAKEIMLYDWKSPIYRGKHPLASYMLEKTYNLRKFSLRQQEAVSTANRLASEIRTTVGKHEGGLQNGFEHAADTMAQELAGKNDFRHMALLRQIRKTGDVNKFADFVAGRYLYADADAAKLEKAIWTTKKQLRLNGAADVDKLAISKEVYVEDPEAVTRGAIEIRSELATHVDLWNQDLEWLNQASPSYTKFMNKKKNEPLRLMLEKEVERRNLLLGNLDETGRGKRYIPLAAERHSWLEVQIPKQDRVPKGIMSQEDLFKQGATDFASTEGKNRDPHGIFDPEQGLGFETAAEAETGIPKKLQRETSKVLRYGDEATDLRLNQTGQQTLDEVRQHAGLLTEDEMKQANLIIKGQLAEQRMLSETSREAGESVYDLQRRVHETVGQFMRERDVALAKTETEAQFKARFNIEHFRGEGMTDKQATKAMEVAREQMVGLAQKQANTAHDVIRDAGIEAMDEIEKFDRMLPFPLNDEFGGLGIRGSIHEQFNQRGMPRGGAVRMSQETKDLETNLDVALLRRQGKQSQLLAAKRQTLGYPAVQEQIVGWHAQAAQEADAAIVKLRDRLDFFSNLETKDAVSQLDDSDANALRYLMESTPGKEVDLSTAVSTGGNRVFPDSTTWAGDPETAAQRLLDNFDETFKMFDLEPADLATVKTNLAHDLAAVAQARYYETRMAQMVDRQMWFDIQNPGLTTPQPRIQVMRLVGNRGSGTPWALEAPMWEDVEGHVIGDVRLNLSDKALKEISRIIWQGGETSREDAIAAITKDMEKRLLNRVEGVAKRDDAAFVDSTELSGAGKPLKREIHGRTPPGSDEPLWTQEQIERNIYNNQNVVNSVRTTKGENLHPVDAAAIDETLGYLADPQLQDALNELGTRIWNAHIEGREFVFHVHGPLKEVDVTGRKAFTAEKGTERLPVFLAKHGDEQLGGKYILEKVNGKWVVKKADQEGHLAKNPVVLDTTWPAKNPPLLANPYRVRKAGKVYQVIDRKGKKVVDLPFLDKQYGNIPDLAGVDDLLGMIRRIRNKIDRGLKTMTG